jgi:hypothetical protein
MFVWTNTPALPYQLTPDARVGGSYGNTQVKLTVHGTFSPGFYTFAIQSGTDPNPTYKKGLPVGISAGSDGFGGFDMTIIFGGVPAALQDGYWNFQIAVTATDSNGNIGSHTYGQYYLLVDPPLCIASNTEILLANGTTKLIQDVVRGDLVAGDPSMKKSYKVANIPSTLYLDDVTMDLVIFKPNSLGINIPNKKLITTPGHPIIWNHSRRAARYFTNCDGVKLVERSLPVDECNERILWDIQFETIGTFVANGVTLQSRHPQSRFTPLPRELYFDDALYSTSLKDDNDPAFDHPLVLSFVLPFALEMI